MSEQEESYINSEEQHPLFLLHELVPTIQLALYWPEYGSENDPDIVLSKQVGISLQAVVVTPVKDEYISTRSVRDLERGLYEGEHPGINVTTNLIDGQRVEINIFGGIRNPFAEIDHSDPSGHTARTNALESLPRQFNVHVYDANGLKVTEVWLVEGRGKYRAVSITAISHIDEYGFKQLEEPIRILEINQRSKYELLHANLSRVVESVIRVLPQFQ